MVEDLQFFLEKGGLLNFILLIDNYYSFWTTCYLRYIYIMAGAMMIQRASNMPGIEKMDPVQYLAK